MQCRYAYDAWGKVLSVKDASGAAITSATHIGNRNPFRYRGYYYDVETGFYYLNSRYYDPTVKRFLNGDGLLNLRESTGYNLFAYCYNNPVRLSDSSGRLPDDRLLSNATKYADGHYFVSIGGSPKPSSASTKPTQNCQPTPEAKAFAATVYAEAGGTNTKTKKAIAHSIKNRVDVGHWTNPKSIMDAISYPSQYDGFGNAKYQAAMEYYNTGKVSSQRWNNLIELNEMKACMDAIIPIYGGEELDFTGGVVYFHSFKNASDWPYHSSYTLVNIPGTETFWFYKE